MMIKARMCTVALFATAVITPVKALLRGGAPQGKKMEGNSSAKAKAAVGAGSFERTGPHTVVYTSTAGERVTLPFEEAGEGGPWLTILNQTQGAISTKPGAAIVNELFQRRSMGVLKYLVDGRPYNFYKRLRDANGFDMYSNLVMTWSSERNAMHLDFEMYGTYADLVTRQSAWEFCNYDDPGVAYPRDCGPSGGIANYWTEFHGPEAPLNGKGQQTTAFQLQLLPNTVPYWTTPINGDDASPCTMVTGVTSTTTTTSNGSTSTTSITNIPCPEESA